MSLLVTVLIVLAILVVCGVLGGVIESIDSDRTLLLVGVALIVIAVLVGVSV